MTTRTSAGSLDRLLGPHARRNEADLGRWLVEPGTPRELARAMRYCAEGGKRLRPALVFLAAEAAGGSARSEMTRRAAAAVEMVHAYSLVHDDLPAMDDDRLRRGRPTAHVKFGEAMAILAGDALLTRAFGVLAEAAHPRAALLAAELACGAGAAGMVAGQAADMELCRVPSGRSGLLYVPLRKTAALIRAALRMGAIGAGADARTGRALGQYGRAMGLAFQVFDDLLDATGHARRLGKTPGKDARAGKRTPLARLGLRRARELGLRLTRQALRAVEPLGRRADSLRELARLLAERTY